MIRLRPQIASLGPYSSGRTGAADDEHFVGKALLASNELSFTPLPSVLKAIEAAARSIHRYPDPSAVSLREAIAEMHGLSLDQVAVGTGSAEVCRQALLAVAGPGDEVVVAEPTFPEYTAIATLAGARTVTVPLVADVHDLKAMAAAVGERTRAVVLCNPNNPTGTALEAAEIDRFVAMLPPDLLVIVDEAYAEFAEERFVSGSESIRTHANVLVLRTFSKAYGLAGLRVGYGLAAPEIVATLVRARIPFGVNSIAQAAATVSLGAAEELRERVAQVVAERRRLVDALHELGLSVPEPQGNFCWLILGEGAEVVAGELEDAGIYVRQFEGALRVTVGTPADDDRLLSALAASKQLRSGFPEPGRGALRTGS